MLTLNVFLLLTSVQRLSQRYVSASENVQELDTAGGWGGGTLLHCIRDPFSFFDTLFHL